MVTEEGVVGWSPETWTAVGTLALAVATLLVVIVALFEEPLRRRFSRAKLTMEIVKGFPETHQIALTHRQTGAPIGSAIYVRIRVTHVGGGAAENAEILAAELWRLQNGGRERVETFLPMSLRWSHFDPPTGTTRVPRRGFRHCDLGHFVPSDFFSYAPPVTGETRFMLDTMVQPNPVAGGELANILAPARYVIELRLTGDNVRPVTGRWLISFEKGWSEDERVMLDRIRIERAQ